MKLIVRAFTPVLFFILSTHLSFAVFANVRVLPRAVDDFARFGVTLTAGETVWVEGAKVAYVNYFALRRDFPRLREYSDAQIDALLLLNFSYISKHQLELGEIRNSAIPADTARTRKSFRPSAYGRADVMEFFDFNGELLGLIDRKGTGLSSSYRAEEQLKRAEVLGLEKIQVLDHSDGLMTFGEALVETSREKARRQLYQIERLDAETVESYFSMQWPFQVKKGNGQLVPAGLYGRQAHLGHMSNGFETPLPNSEKLAIQMDYFGAGFDQGLIRITDPRLASTFGNFGPTVYDPQKRADWAWAHETAAAFAQHGQRASIERHLAEMTKPLESFNPVDSPDRSTTLIGDLDRFFLKYGNLENQQSRFLMSHALPKFVDAELIEKYEVRGKLIRLMSDPAPEIRLRTLPGLKIFQVEQRAPLLQNLSQDTSVDVQLGLFNLLSLDKRSFTASEINLALENFAKSEFPAVRERVAIKRAAEQERLLRPASQSIRFEPSSVSLKRLICQNLFGS